MAEKNAKRLVTIELEDEVKKLSITGMNSDEQVLMSRELGEDLLDQVAGGQREGRNNLPHK
jgi:hypothetical protein